MAKDGTPALLYRHGKTDITDRLTPKGDGLQRRMEFSAGEGQLRVRLAVANEFLTTERGVWLGDNNLTLIAPTSRVRTLGVNAELIAPVELKATGNTILEVQLSW